MCLGKRLKDLRRNSEKRRNEKAGEQANYEQIFKMECYATPWQLWRAVIYCGTL